MDGGSVLWKLLKLSHPRENKYKICVILNYNNGVILFCPNQMSIDLSPGGHGALALIWDYETQVFLICVFQTSLLVTMPQLVLFSLL